MKHTRGSKYPMFHVFVFIKGHILDGFWGLWGTWSLWDILQTIVTPDLEPLGASYSLGPPMSTTRTAERLLESQQWLFGHAG